MKKKVELTFSQHYSILIILLSPEYMSEEENTCTACTSEGWEGRGTTGIIPSEQLQSF